jgi:hypothetical protein
MNTITINGVTIQAGRSITISNNRVIINGQDVTPDAKNIRIEVAGNIESLSADSCNSVTVTGDARSVKTVSGDVDIRGSVGGSVSTISGDVTSGGVIEGSVSTVSGDVRHR